MFDSERDQREQALRRWAERRQQRAKDSGPAALAAELRAFYYPKQRAFLTSKARQRATRKTRRMGATSGGCREFIACALEQPGFRATYATTTRQEAVDRAWRNDNATGFYDLLAAFGDHVKHPSLQAFNMGGIVVEVRESDLKLEFSNGSQIELFGAETFRMQKRKRGNAKHKFWIDEAQDFPELEKFFDAVVIGSITDTEGDIWLTGTPGLDCVGMFWDVTKEAEDGEEPLAGWEVHEITVTDNPFFGRVVARGDEWWIEGRPKIDALVGPFEDRDEAERRAIKLRWDRTAGEAMRLKGWKGDEPDFIREWTGKWVRQDARYVYPVHALPKHQLLFAPQRLRDNPFIGSDPRFDGHPPWYDHHAAVRDLPRKGRDGRPHKWLYSLWFDFGYYPDPFALVMWAFCTTLPDVYEMFSWKQTRVDSEQQGLYIKRMWEVDDAIVSFGGDAANKKAEFAAWARRMNMPLQEADKQGKNMLEELLANDVRRGVVHLREGSPLYTEMRHLVYLPGKPGKTREVHKHRAVQGVVHGDHCCDAARYGFTDLTHYLSKLGTERPPAGSPAAYAAEAERIEKELDDREARRERREEELDARDEMADEMAEEWARSEYQWE